MAKLFTVSLLAVLIIAVSGNSIEERLLHELEELTKDGDLDLVAREIERKNEAQEKRGVNMCPAGKKTSVVGAGGTGGECFSDRAVFDGSGQARITGFHVRAGWLIDCFGVQYAHLDGYCHGGAGGNPSVVDFDSDEYIVAITGRQGSVVNMLQVHTNKKMYGPYGGIYGGAGGDPFTLEAGQNEIGYITGSAGGLLDNIGASFRC